MSRYNPRYGIYQPAWDEECDRQYEAAMWAEHHREMLAERSHRGEGMTKAEEILNDFNMAIAEAGPSRILAAIDADDKLSDDAKAAMKDLVTVVYKQLTEGCDDER